MEPYAHICNEPVVTPEKERFAEIAAKIAEKFIIGDTCQPEFANTENESEFEVSLIEYVTEAIKYVGYDGPVNVSLFFEEYFSLPGPILILSFLGDGIILYRRLKWVGLSELAACLLECILRIYKYTLNSHHML
jgi:hypothetical protein